MGKRLAILFLGFCVLTGVGTLLLISFSQQSLEESPFNRQVFNKKIWDEYYLSMDRDSLRGAMANDVKKRLMKQKTSKQDVLAMLGEPDLEKRDRLFSYHLGMWSKSRNKIDALNVSFDDNDHVTSVYFSAH